MTPNFSLRSDPKLACSCGCGLIPEQSAVERLQVARETCERLMRADGFTSGFGWHITSGARCPTHNSKVSRTGRTGPHTTRRAFDIGVSGPAAHYALRALLSAGFTGIGVNQKGDSRFLHADDLTNGPTSPRPWVWSY